ncbi:MAG: hypothetical protein WEA04_00290 [Candidatus Andersenbacteria bacterium]
MQFAVIEYSSKTGRIWKHTPARPNYLSDPQREIDPTSFGCYVSALAGEHVPLIGMITGDINPVSSLTRFTRRVIKKLTGAWPQTYDISYLKKFDTIMLVHQLSDAHEIAAFAKRLRQLYPHIFILGVPTQPYGILKAHLENQPHERQTFIEYMNACDLFLTVVKDTQAWYESMARKPVVYLPQIYPAHYASQFFKPRSHKQKALFVAGVTERDNIAEGQRLTAALQRQFPEYIIRVTKIPGLKLDLSALAGARYEVVEFAQWREHLPFLAEQMLVINTDYLFTRGRVQVDCAAVGTPSLGANSDGQTDLFPALAGGPHLPIEKLEPLARKLLTDKVYYQQITDQARDKLQKYDYEESAVRLQLLVKQYRS